MSDKIDLGDGEVALGGVGVEVIGGKEGESGAKVVLMFFHVAGEYQDVIKVDNDE